MRTVPYKTILDKVSGYLGENGGMSAEDAGLANRLFNTRLRWAWEYYWWPDCMAPVVQVQFRPSWNAATNYAAGTATAGVEVYYPPAQAYYQSLQPNTGQPPTLDSSGTVNAAFWAPSLAGYGGTLWAVGGVYAVGDIAQNPNDRRYYQCIVAETAGANFDYTAFAILTPFVRSIDPEHPIASFGQLMPPLGEIRALWDRDPNANYDARAIQKVIRPGFILARGTVPVVFPEYRLQPPDYSGLPWAAGTGYTPGQEVYYDAVGDYFICSQATNSVVPGADPATWEQVTVPYIFAEYLAQSVYGALAAREDQVPEDFGVEESAGFPLLLAELQKIERQQGQVRQMNVTDSRPGGW